MGRLRDTLRLTNGFAQAPQGLLPRLARCFLVDGRSTAQRLSTAYPDCYFLLPDGVSYHGHAVSGGRKTGGGPLALKRELRDLSGQVESRERETEALTARLEEHKAQLKAASDQQIQEMKNQFEAQRAHQVEIVVVGEDGDEEARLDAQVQVGTTTAKAGESLQVPFAIDLRNVPLPKPGAYELRVYVDGSHRRTTQFWSEQVPTSDVL